MRSPAAAYQHANQTIASPRELEASLLMKAAARLQIAQETLRTESDDSQLDDALTYNRRLWTILTTSVTQDGNQLPDEIKDNIVTLGTFILRRTLDLLTDPAPENIAVLISINRNIALGLRGEAG